MNRSRTPKTATGHEGSMVSPGRLPSASFVRNILNGIVGSLCVFQFLLSAPVFAQTPAPLSSPGTAAVVNGIIEIDGVKFFPFGFYHVSQYGTEAQLLNTLNLIAAAGFNLLHSGYIGSFNYGAYLDQAAQKGVRVVTEFEMSSALLTTLINNYASELAVLAWNIADDVDSGTKTHAQVKAIYNQAKTSDPRHLTYVSGYRAPNEPGPGGVTSATFMDVTDLLGMQRYPINNGGPIRIVWQANASNVGLPVIANLQAFDWNDSHGNRFPTPAEGRNMTYQAIAAGVKGIIYYTFFDGGNYLPTGSPSLWAELKALVPEVKTLGPVLLNGEMTRALADVSGDRFATYWTYQGRLYVIVMNTSTTSAKSFSLPMPAGTSGPAQPLFSGRPSGMTFTNGVLGGTVQPLDVHVYVLNGSMLPPASPTNLQVK